MTTEPNVDDQPQGVALTGIFGPTPSGLQVDRIEVDGQSAIMLVVANAGAMNVTFYTPEQARSIADRLIEVAGAVGNLTIASADVLDHLPPSR